MLLFKTVLMVMQEVPWSLAVLGTLAVLAMAVRLPKWQSGESVRFI